MRFSEDDRYIVLASPGGKVLHRNAEAATLVGVALGFTIGGVMGMIATSALLSAIVALRTTRGALAELDIDEHKLPRPVACDEVVGTINEEAARLTGLQAGTPVVGGCMDTIGASLGTGVLDVFYALQLCLPP